MGPGVRQQSPQDPPLLAEAAALAHSVEDIAGLLRDLRRRHARSRRDSRLTYRELAARTGWSQAAVAEYFTARTLPPTDRFDALVEVLGATAGERRVLADARDRVEENLRRVKCRAERAASDAAAPVPIPAPPLTPAEPAHVTGPALVPPRQLPAAPRLFAGRERELARLSAAVDEQARDGGTLVVSAIGGAGGIGKTWLALQWAHRNLDRFPDGQLYIDLRGFDPSGPPLAPAAAVRGFLEALGVAPATIPVEPDAQVGLYRSLLADRRMLILADNARDASQVTPLLPGGPGCTVLVTSRHRLGTLATAHGAYVLDLDAFTPEEAHQALVGHLGAQRAAAEPAAFAELLACCAGLPLALGIVGARAAGRPDFPLGVLAAELRDLAYRLDALDPGDPLATLRAVLSCSLRTLSPSAAAAFALLNLAPGPDVALPAAASLLARPAAETRVLLRELEHASLLHQSASGRYRMHDLVRLYAADRAQQERGPEERDAALRRVLDFYIHTALRADLLLSPHRQPLDLDPPAPGVEPGAPCDDDEALAWFEAEHANLLAAQPAAAARRRHAAVWLLAWTLTSFHRRRGHLREDLAAWQAALAAAEHLPDAAARTRAHRLLGVAHAEVGSFEDAATHLEFSLARAGADQNSLEQAHTHFQLAAVWDAQGDDKQALHHATCALNLYRALGQPVWEAQALNSVGWCAASLGDYASAREHCRAALDLHREHGHVEGQAQTLDSLGYIDHCTGCHEQALDRYGQALDLYRALDDDFECANTLDHLGAAYAALGRTDRARAAWREAFELYQARHRLADADRMRRRLDTAG